MAKPPQHLCRPSTIPTRCCIAQISCPSLISAECCVCTHFLSVTRQNITQLSLMLLSNQPLIRTSADKRCVPHLVPPQLERRLLLLLPIAGLHHCSVHTHMSKTRLAVRQMCMHCHSYSCFTLLAVLQHQASSFEGGVRYADVSTQ